MDKTLYNNTYRVRNGNNWLLTVLCFFLLCSCTNKRESVRILFVGDILLSRTVKEEYTTRNTFPWEKLSPLFASADLVIGNLEGAVGTPGENTYPLAPSPVFAIDSSDIQMLSKAGFDAMTIENNHSLDLGSRGKTKTSTTLVENNIKSISLENSPYFFETKGYVISIISLNLVLNRDSSKYIFPSIELDQKLRLAKALSTVVVVSVHWGSELLEWPNKEQRSAAKWLISKGADVIIGHHPHVIQQPELIDGKPVYFSLGNHLFDQKYSSTKEGLIADIEIKDGNIKCKGIVTHTQKHSFYPETQGHPVNFFKPVAIKKHVLELNTLEIIPESIDLVSKTRLKAYHMNQLVWKSHPMSLVSLQKMDIDGSGEHLFTLESYYSPLDNEITVRPYVYAVNTKGITARWRGSALAWPLLDAQVLPTNDHVLCALHRGDAFISLGTIRSAQRVAAYTWNGFGFKQTTDSAICSDCEQVYK